MKHILIPTDLSVASLYPVHGACRENEGAVSRITFMHTLEMPGGIAELLFNSTEKPYHLLSPEFREALDIIRRKYSSPDRALVFEFFYGNGKSRLRQFIQSRLVHEIWMLEDFDYAGGLPQSLPSREVMYKLDCPVKEVSRPYQPAFEALGSLLYYKKTPAPAGEEMLAEVK